MDAPSDGNDSLDEDDGGIDNQFPPPPMLPVHHSAEQLAHPAAPLGAAPLAPPAPPAAGRGAGRGRGATQGDGGRGRGRGRGRGSSSSNAAFPRCSLWSMNMSSASHAAQQESHLLNSLFGEPQAGASDQPEDGETLGSNDSPRSLEGEDDEFVAPSSELSSNDGSEPRRYSSGHSTRQVRQRTNRTRSRTSSAPHRDRRGHCISSSILSSAFGTTIANFDSSTLDDQESDEGSSEHELDEEHADPHADDDVERHVFNVPGVSCVGCTLDPARLAPINAFIDSNAASKQSEALWRTAESLYRSTVIMPCRRERSNAPEWTWQEIRTHYLEHVVSSKLCRLQTCRELAAMRRVLVSQMIVANDENGSQEIDKPTLEQYLKVVTTESREHALLSSAENSSRSATTANSRHGSSIVPMTNAGPAASSTDEI